jgi:FixJ family two-component response regulator
MSVSTRKTIFVLDGDADIRNLICEILQCEGYDMRSFVDVESMLVAARDLLPACIIVDIDMRHWSGSAVLTVLGPAQIKAPVIAISGLGDIQAAAEAIKNGAIDFIEKPFRIKEVADRVAEALTNWAQQQVRPSAHGSAALPQFRGCELLTPREQLVLSHLIRGASNKEVGRILKVSPRTIEVHRAHIMRKLRVRNAAGLIRVVLGG